MAADHLRRQACPLSPARVSRLRVKYEQTISHIKEAVSEKLHVPVNRIQLFWQKRELTKQFDTKTLLEMHLHTGFSLRGYDLVRGIPPLPRVSLQSEQPDYWPAVEETSDGLIEVDA